MSTIRAGNTNTTALVYISDTTGILNLESADNVINLGSNTGSMVVPKGTTAQRNVAPAEGSLRFNTTTSNIEVYKGGTWTGVGGGAAGTNGNAAFYLNDTNITANYTIPNGQNAMTAGPVTINDGITVTVSDGSVWTVV